MRHIRLVILEKSTMTGTINSSGIFGVPIASPMLDSVDEPGNRRVWYSSGPSESGRPRARLVWLFVDIHIIA